MSHSQKFSFSRRLHARVFLLLAFALPLLPAPSASFAQEEWDADDISLLDQGLPGFEIFGNDLRSGRDDVEICASGHPSRVTAVESVTADPVDMPLSIIATIAATADSSRGAMEKFDGVKSGIHDALEGFPSAKPRVSRFMMMPVYDRVKPEVVAWKADAMLEVEVGDAGAISGVSNALVEAGISSFSGIVPRMNGPIPIGPEEAREAAAGALATAMDMALSLGLDFAAIEGISVLMSGLDPDSAVPFLGEEKAHRSVPATRTAPVPVVTAQVAILACPSAGGPEGGQGARLPQGTFPASRSTAMPFSPS